MSAVTITITLPPASQAFIQRFHDMPQELPRAIKRGMDQALPVVAGRIVINRLSGRGPYPAIQHQLGEKTGRLRRSVRAEPAVIRGNDVTGAIGSNVIYAPVHEFGNAKMPERAPFRTGINENADYIAEEIGAEIEETLKK
jgi:phage gpG-like protein